MNLWATLGINEHNAFDKNPSLAIFAKGPAEELLPKATGSKPVAIDNNCPSPRRLLSMC